MKRYENAWETISSILKPIYSYGNNLKSQKIKSKIVRTNVDPESTSKLAVPEHMTNSASNLDQRRRRFENCATELS